MRKKDKRLEQILRRKAAMSAGIFPGMGRKTSPFIDRRKEENRKFCRRKPRED